MMRNPMVVGFHISYSSSLNIPLQNDNVGFCCRVLITLNPKTERQQADMFERSKRSNEANYSPYSRFDVNILCDVKINRHIPYISLCWIILFIFNIVLLIPQFLTDAFRVLLTNGCPDTTWVCKVTRTQVVSWHQLVNGYYKIKKKCHWKHITTIIKRFWY